MKPYDKKIINKKITQALIGVTALGTILSLPVSIDMQDNGIRIVRNNKVFAADNFKGLTGNVEWINGDFNNNILGLPIPNDSDNDWHAEDKQKNSIHNKLWHWYNVFSWVQDKAIWESNNYVYRGNQGARYLAAGRYNYNGGAWRPALEVLDSDPLISNKKSGDIVKFGTLYINNKKIKRPTDPVSFNGNIIEYNGGNIEIKNTDNDDDYKLQWIYIKDGDKNLLISDRALIKRITWSQLNSQNLVAGKDFNIEGTDYKCRLLTGGNDGEGSSHFGDKGALDLDNEWDRYISMEYWMKFIDKFYNTSSIKKYGSWANTYYGKRRIDGNYGGFDANSKKTFAFNNIIDESEIKSKYIFPNGRIVVIDNYGMVSDYKNFTDTQPTTVPIDGTKIKNMFLGHIEDIGLVPMMEKDDGYIWYIDNDNKERMLPIEKSEFNDTIVYHKKNNESDKFLFIKNDGKLTYFDKNRFEKETAINMNDVEKVLSSTNVTDDLFLMKDGTIKNLDGTQVDFQGKKLKKVLSNRFLLMDDNFIYTLQGMSIKNTNTLETLHNKSVNNLLWLKNGKVMIADDNGDLSFLNDVNGKLIKTLVKIDETGTFILMKDNTTKAYGSVKNCGDLLSKGIDYNNIISIVSDDGENGDKKFIIMKNGTLYDFDGKLTGAQLTSTAASDMREESDFTFDDTESKDKEAPEIDLTGIPSDWTNKDFTVKVTATDNTKVKSIKLPDGTVVNGDTGTFTIKENGTYSFVAEDEAGNTKTKELKVSNIDKVAPTKPSITRIEDSIKITEGKDNESGIKQTLYKINNGNWIDLKDFNLDNLITGENIIYAKSIDKAGNESDVSEFKLTIEDKDKEAPTLEITGNPVDWTNKDIILNVSAKDNKKVKSITLPDGKVVNGDKTTFTISENGTYKFIVEDMSGNKATKEVVINKIDKELPLANINIKDNKMTIAASDKLSGIKEIFYKIDNGEFVRYTGEVTLSPGTHKIKVKAIDNAGNMNDQNNSSSEINVNVEDEGKKNLEDATKAVEKAENSQNQDDVDKAREKVNKLPDGKEKDNLNNRLDEVQNKINEKKDQEQKAKEEKEAKDAVEKAENSQNQDDVDKAREKVNKLPDGKEKDNLNNRLDEVQDKINKKKDQEQKLKEEKEAKDAVEKAEKTKKDEDIKDAENKVSKLEDGKVKDDLTDRLDDLEKQIKAEKDAYIKAYNAVKKAKTTLDKEDYEYAKKAVQELNTTIYKNEKAQLQRVLDALKPYIDRKENQSKQEERNQIRNIESLIRKAIATKDPKTIEEAQAAIDKLESSDIKIELQRRLDTTNKVSQIDLAIQARDAVEKLDAYLNYSDIINNLDELKDLYKKAEKATNRLDNNSQYINRIDKAKGYMDVMETLAKYKENAEKNNILASEKEMTELISKANQL
ncbi:OmpL47-type beta-barrel domain-containing protein, partial [Clostridium sporogenes]